ncbi:hypothetical protein PVBG_06263 [Plasmodium vivax Brazil I]|uniref:Uncharacterized protein n=1 Tax=Plasmodium vivax (strain Brazil I) TaxID=1033975 RepID=A0A0J9T2Q3_PLAV1|nr:hypothetical protein PVBG_06263 [Plasmodium vivax Brazil I]
MTISLDELANKEVYKGNAEYENLFNKLDNTCNEKSDHNPCEKSFKYGKIDESFIPQLKKIFNILKRTKIQNGKYINVVNLGNHDPCLYYKYWFYYKIINSNLKTDDIEVLMYIWNENIRGIYRNIWEKECKFYAKSLDDVKIMKVLYDHIFFFNDKKDNTSLMEKIKKCEFCKHLIVYLNQVINKKPITCSHGSPYAFCMEYNNHLKEFFKLDEINNLSCEGSENDSHYPSQVNSHEQVVEEEARNMQDDASQLQFSDKNSLKITLPENAQDSNLSTNNTIIGTSILGVSSFLFLLYKVYKNAFQKEQYTIKRFTMHSKVELL